MAMTEQEIAHLSNLKDQDSRRAYLKEFARALAEQCRGENLSVKEFDWVIIMLRRYVAETTLRDGLTLR